MIRINDVINTTNVFDCVSVCWLVFFFWLHMGCSCICICIFMHVPNWRQHFAQTILPKCTRTCKHRDIRTHA